jgi:hypothetical protein
MPIGEQKARLWMEFADGHRVEMQLDGSSLFWEPEPPGESTPYQRGVSPDWLRDYGHLFDVPPQKFMIHAICNPSDIIKKEQ